MALRKKLVVKGGVGRSLLDTSKLGCQFTLEPCERGWLMRIGDVNAELAESIVEMAEEIHFFYYEDDDEGDSHRKWWLSDTDSPVVGYDPESATLTIEVSQRIGFTIDSSEHGKQ